MSKACVLINGKLRQSCVLLANYVPKCQMSSGPHGPIFVCNSPRHEVEYKLHIFVTNAPCTVHGSHWDWKSGKTWKNGKAFSSQGKVREICQDWKSQGILPKILEKQENLNKKIFFVKVREFYTKCWKISGFEKITVSRSYLILFSQTSQVSWHLFL